MSLETTESQVEETTEAQITETPAVESSPAESVPDVQSGGEGGADAQSGIDAELAALADHYRINPADFGNDPERVRGVVARYDQQLAQFGRQLMQPKQAPQEQAKAAPVAKSEFDFDKLLPGELPADNFDPALTGWAKQSKEAIRQLHEYHTQQRAAEREALKQELLGEINPIRERFQQREAEVIRSQVDGFFNGLGKEWEGEFGKGEQQALASRNPRLAQQRYEVVVEADALRLGYEAQGLQPPPMTTLLKRAVASLYADKQTTFTRQALVQEAAKQKAVAAAAPAKRSTPSSDRDRAAQAYREGVQQLRAAGLMSK